MIGDGCNLWRNYIDMGPTVRAPRVDFFLCTTATVPPAAPPAAGLRSGNP